MTNYLTQQELQTFAPDLDLSAFTPTTISGVISRASARVNAICQVKGLDLATEICERDRAAISGLGELFINVRRRPIQNWNTSSPSISAIRLTKGQFSVSLQLMNGNPGTAPLYQISHPGNTVHYPSAYLAGTGTLMIGGSAQLMTLKGADVFYEIDYTGGYATIPDDVKEATTLIVRDILSRRYNAQGADTLRQGSMTVHFNNTQKTPFIGTAVDMLYQGGYVRSSVF